MNLRVPAITVCGVVAGDPLLDPEQIVRWVRQPVFYSPEERSRSAVRWLAWSEGVVLVRGAPKLDR